jgi:hypothetical protein
MPPRVLCDFSVEPSSMLGFLLKVDRSGSGKPQSLTLHSYALNLRVAAALRLEREIVITETSTHAELIASIAMLNL